MESPKISTFLSQNNHFFVGEIGLKSSPGLVVAKVPAPARSESHQPFIGTATSTWLNLRLFAKISLASENCCDRRNHFLATTPQKIFCRNNFLQKQKTTTATKKFKWLHCFSFHPRLGFFLVQTTLVVDFLQVTTIFTGILPRLKAPFPPPPNPPHRLLHFF